MKQAISLIEVLVSVVIITVVIGSLLKIKDQNLSILQSSNERTLNQSYISLFALNHGVFNHSNDKMLISNELLLRDDDLKRSSQNIIIERNIHTPSVEEESVFKFKIQKVNYELNDGYNNTFYTIRLEE